jgi:alkanesulfonate monooxygenase SsuD/methylene tetrahydromethanopterin reductase-like flavin-dependent oxidoreductase (luciferase family)
VNFDKIWADPKPVQKPHPPILIGGDGATTFDRVVEFGDGWMPIMRPHTSPVEKIPELRERLKKAGRDPKTAPVSIFFAPPKRPALDALQAAGVERAIFGVPSEGREAVLPRLDAYAAAMKG